jgi:membrane fusion protein, heavy metal efflux system
MKAPAILFIFFLLLASCASSHLDEHDHDHEHDEVKVYFTAYSDSYEIFAEADPFAVGQNSNILVHVTNLADFKPIPGGRVVVSLISGNKGIRQTLTEADRPGIYRFVLQPEEPGPARLQISIEADGTLETLEAGLTEVFADAHAAIHAAEDLMIDVPGAVVFTKEQSWVIDFATNEAKRDLFGPIVRTVGEVSPERGDEKVLNAQTSGFVSFEGNAFYEGMQVGGSQALLSIQGSALSDGNAAIRYQEAKNAYDRTKADYLRIQQLYNDRIASERELLQARNDYDNAAALFKNLQQHFTESGQMLRSPWNGYLKKIFVSEGEFVEMGQPILSIARNRSMVIHAEVQPHYAGILSNINDANISLPGRRPKSLQELNGEVISVARSIDKNTNMLSVYLRVSPQENMIPGSLLDVYLKPVATEEILLVPNEALIEEQGNYFVFIQNHPESFSKRQVRTGYSDGLMTEVVSGLTDHERIVTRGAIMVKLAAASGDLDPHSGHVH